MLRGALALNLYQRNAHPSLFALLWNYRTSRLICPNHVRRELVRNPKCILKIVELCSRNHQTPIFISDSAMLSLVPLSWWCYVLLRILGFLHHGNSSKVPKLLSRVGPCLAILCSFVFHGCSIRSELPSEACPLLTSGVSSMWTKTCTCCLEPPHVHVWYNSSKSCFSTVRYFQVLFQTFKNVDISSSHLNMNMSKQTLFFHPTIGFLGPLYIRNPHPMKVFALSWDKSSFFFLPLCLSLSLSTNP